MAQSWGYLFAAIGPLALGALRDLTGGWLVPLLLLAALLVPQAVSAYLAGRPALVGRLDGMGGTDGRGGRE
jgi:CP family cyanate transporter-like MFS transporter